MDIALVAYAVPQSRQIAIKGMDSYVYNLGKEFRRLGHKVQLYVRAPVAAAGPWIVPVATPTFSWLAYPHFLTGRLSPVQADVYHAEYVGAGSALVHAKKRPCVVSIHDVIPFSDRAEGVKPGSFSSRIGQWMYFRWFQTMSKADALIMMSQHAKKEAILLTGIPPEKLHVVYNGVDCERFYPLKKKRKSEKIHIGYLGGLDGRKNVGLLVDAFRELQNQYEHIELHVGGTGRNLDVFRSMKIPHSFFHGFIPDDRLNEFYNSLDIFVLPSLKEGFGNMALEAMAAGVPVVATKRTSLPEVVGDAGLLAEPTVAAMAEKITRLIDNENLRKKLSRAGRERALTMTWQVCAKNTAKVYEQVLD